LAADDVPVKNGFTVQKIQALTLTAHVTTREQLIETTETLTSQNQQRMQSEIRGSAVPFIRFVDGVKDKPLESVNPQGFTLTQFAFLGPVVDEALMLLMSASPVGPDEGGHYRDDHWLYVDGVRVDTDISSSPVDILPTQTVRVINRRPYAKKIEGGFRHNIGSGKRSFDKRRPGLSVQAPNGVYEVTAMELRHRFGGIASIIFTYSSEDGSNDAMGGFPALEIKGL
jgi:hypothetical protein